MERRAAAVQSRELRTLNHLFASLALLLACSPGSRLVLFRSIFPSHQSPGLNQMRLQAISPGLEYYRRNEVAIR